MNRRELLRLPLGAAAAGVVGVAAGKAMASGKSARKYYEFVIKPIVDSPFTEEYEIPVTSGRAVRFLVPLPREHADFHYYEDVHDRIMVGSHTLSGALWWTTVYLSEVSIFETIDELHDALYERALVTAEGQYRRLVEKARTSFNQAFPPTRLAAEDLKHTEVRTF